LSKLCIVTTLIGLSLSACSADPRSSEEMTREAEQAANLALPIRLGAQAVDWGGSDQFGHFRYVSNGPPIGVALRVSAPVCDADGYDPDALRLKIETDPTSALYQAFTGAAGLDFRFGIHAVGDAWDALRPWSFTPFASEGGGWSTVATTGAGDPDCYLIAIDTRPWPLSSKLDVSRIRAGLFAFDNGANSGAPVITPVGGGVSPFAFDGDLYDPDGFAIGLFVD